MKIFFDNRNNLFIVLLFALIFLIIGVLINYNKEDVKFSYKGNNTLDLSKITETSFAFDYNREEVDMFIKKIARFISNEEFNQQINTLYNENKVPLNNVKVTRVDDEIFSVDLTSYVNVDLDILNNYISKIIGGFLKEVQYEYNFKKIIQISKEVEQIQNDYLFIKGIANDVFSDYLKVKNQTGNDLNAFIKFYQDKNYSKLSVSDDDLFSSLHDNFISEVYNVKTLDEFINMLYVTIKTLENEIQNFLFKNYTDDEYFSNNERKLKFYFSNFMDLIFLKDRRLLLESIFERNSDLLTSFDDDNFVRFHNYKKLEITNNNQNFFMVFYFLKDKKDYLENQQVFHYNNLGKLCDFPELFNPDLTKITSNKKIINNIGKILECKSNKKYFDTNIYLSTKILNEVLKNVIQSSINSNSFQVDRSDTIFRNKIISIIFYLIFGLFLGVFIVLLRTNFLIKK